jgi:ABC-type lipoprotein export system ATPase subunit
MSFHGTLHSLVLEALQPNGQRLRILDIPHLSFASGERVGISGPSGSGKTSLLHCLAGLVVPDQGEIVWDQIPITRLEAKASDAWRLRHVGLIFQDFQLIPELSVSENILLTDSFSHWRLREEARMQVHRQAEALGVLDMDQRVSNLSRGEQQRVAVARALRQNPPLILADEPTASLDRTNADKVMQALLAYADSRRATLVVASHDPAILALMDRVIPLAHGRVQAGAEEV